MAQHFSHYKSMGIFRRSRASKSAVRGQIWLKFKLIRDVINVPLTYKNEEDPIKNKGARVATRLCQFLGAQGEIIP